MEAEPEAETLAEFRAGHSEEGRQQPAQPANPPYHGERVVGEEWDGRWIQYKVQAGDSDRIGSAEQFSSV